LYVDELIERHAQEVADQLPAIARWAKSEEDLRIETEKLLSSFLHDAGVDLKGHHEYSIGTGRADSVYSLVIIEYKQPKRLGSGNDSSANKEAISQLKDRFNAFEREERRPKNTMFGVALDGFRIIFVRFRAGEWEISDPLAIDMKTIAVFLRRLSALGAAGKALLPSYLVGDFGADSPRARSTVARLFGKVRDLRNPRAQKMFEQWMVMFSEVCGYDLHNPKEHVKELGQRYGLGERTRPEMMLFAVHTYYAIFMKLLATEIITFYHRMPSFLGRLAALTGETLRQELRSLEKGGIFRQMGIANLFEGDLFAWYVDEWDDSVEAAIRSMVEGLEEYDPSTLRVEPDEARDLLKELYQYLIDRPVRHDLGEYYTPDWLADLVLREAGYTGELGTRMLDPGCGSGTFLVAAINSMRRNAERDQVPPRELLKAITDGVVGFDLNPLAVMASRVNYVIALGELLRYVREEIEIPVYLCDSILIPNDYAPLYEGSRRIRTSVGEFHVPEIVIVAQKMGALATLLEECASNKCSSAEFLSRVPSKLAMSEQDMSECSEMLGEIFKKISQLEAKGIDGIWSRIIKNGFAPMFAGTFDYVLGNPPWINWENLPEGYRRVTTPIWERLGLAAKAGSKQFELGKMKRDLAILFTYVSADKYLRLGGTLGFLVTQTVFKTQGSEVFRSFSLPDGTPLKVVRVHDMVELQPFEDAANRTSLIVLRKGEKNVYPVPYVVWRRKQGGSFSHAGLDEVLIDCERREFAAQPIDDADQTSPWLTAPTALLATLNRVKGRSAYKAFLGVNSGGANGVYWVEIVGQAPGGDIIIRNLHDAGKKKIEERVLRVETDLLYPLVRSGDSRKWFTKPEFLCIVPHTTETDWQAIPETVMKTKYPRIYGYLSDFKEELLARSAYKLLRLGHPFYIMVDIHSHSFAQWKVAWKRMGSSIEASVIGPCEIPNVGKKTPIPQETISFVPLSNAKEAYYLCGFLNSSPVNLLIQSFSQTGGKSFATPSVLERVSVPKYDEKNRDHGELAELGAAAERDASSHNLSRLAEIEGEVDQVVGKILGLSSRDLKAIKHEIDRE